MVTRSKNMQLFLMDGDDNGRIKCTLANWIGVAFKIPRSELSRCKDRDELKQSGVYFLFGPCDELGKDVAYIGQAGARKNGEGILQRLQEHDRNPKKGNWREAIVFTTSNNSFGATEISYLENSFYNKFFETGRFNLKNKIDPTHGNLTEEKRSEMDEFIECAIIVLGILGYKIVAKDKKAISVIGEEYQDKVRETGIPLHLERVIKDIGKVEADGFQTSEGFVVLKGSHISLIDDDTIPATVKEYRRNASIDENGILKEDMLFSSPTYAAMFVIGKSSNGLTRWKTTDGRTLKSLQEDQ